MILTVIEHDNGHPTDPSLEALTLARSIDSAASVSAVVFENQGHAVADELGEYGVETVYHVDDDRLNQYAPEAWAESIAQAITEYDPEAVVAPGSDKGQELLARVGARLNLPMSANCLSVEAADETYELSRQRWAGTLVEHAKLSADTKLLTAAKHEVGVEPAAEPTTPSLETFNPTLDDSEFRVVVDRIEESDEGGVPLGEARVVVGGGRGVGDPDDYDKLEELAEHLDGTVGASRAAVNEGWRPHNDQIGQTGTKISPKLYIACGISGAVQHWVGCSGSDNVLAINTDPEAAIMHKADYAVVGDLHEVVPELNKRLTE